MNVSSWPVSAEVRLAIERLQLEKADTGPLIRQMEQGPPAGPHLPLVTPLLCGTTAPSASFVAPAHS